MTDHLRCSGCGRTYLPRNVESTAEGLLCLTCLGLPSGQAVGGARERMAAAVKLVAAAAADLPDDASPNDHLVQIAVRRILASSAVREMLSQAMVASLPDEGGQAA